MTEPLLELSDISKSFRGLRALDGVSLQLGRNQVLGLVGDNAAGKSTLMKIISGTYTADAGHIVFDGREVKHNSPKRARDLGIEMVYQNLQLCPNLDVPSNLFLGREIQRGGFLDKKSMETATTEILEKLQIEMQNPLLRVDLLSGGQQQAVAISKAVSFNPKLVIMDEPTANLAAMEIGKVLELIVSLKDHGISVIIISHRLDDIFEVSDRIMVLRRGRKAGEMMKAETDRKEILGLMFED